MKRSDCEFCKKSTSVIVAVILAALAISLFAQGGWIMFFPLLGFAIVSLFFGWEILTVEDLKRRNTIWLTKAKARPKPKSKK